MNTKSKMARLNKTRPPIYSSKKRDLLMNAINLIIKASRDTDCLNDAESLTYACERLEKHLNHRLRHR
jgi:hypothetical protein